MNVGGARQRAVLALLADRRGTPVSTEALIDGVWGDRPPESATKTVRAYVSRLRSALGADVLSSTHSGYLLDVADDAVDAARFERRVCEARTLATQAPADAAAVLRDALAQQPPSSYGGLDDCPGAVLVISALEESRLAALELRMELEIALGTGAGKIAELTQLVADHPFRERFAAALMRALYQAGRQTEALETFQRVRRVLDEELGLQPGPELRELEAAILTHDPGLATADRVPAVPRHLVPRRLGPRVPPTTRYAKTDDGLHIAYQIVGDGPVDLVFFGAPLSHIELAWQEPRIAAFYEGLSSFARLILFDKRGVGMSDPVTRAPTLAERMDDARAVMDAAASAAAVMFGISEGGQLGVSMAATRPERVKALAGYGTFACIRRLPDYPIGIPERVYATLLDLVEHDWGGRQFLDLVVPSFAEDPELVDRFRTYARSAVSPGGVIAQFARNYEHDVRALLPRVTVPSLVMHAVNEQFVRAAHGRYMAERIPGARYVELPGADHLPYGENADAIIHELRTLVTRVS